MGIIHEAEQFARQRPWFVLIGTGSLAVCGLTLCGQMVADRFFPTQRADTPIPPRTALPTQEMLGEALETALPTATIEPTVTPETLSLTGSWAIMEIRQDTYSQVVDGKTYYYDTALFRNPGTGQEVWLMCMDPQFPNPSIGALYQANDALVFTSGQYGELQRFTPPED